MMSLMELNYFTYERHFELENWAKVEKLYNCEGFFDLFRTAKKRKLNK